MNTNVAIFSTQTLPDQPPSIVSGEPGLEARGIENLLFCAAGHRNGLKKNGETYAEHLQNISVHFVSYLHAAHPHTAAHVESELERTATTQPHTLISDITHDWENTVRAISSVNRRTKI